MAPALNWSVAESGRSGVGGDASESPGELLRESVVRWTLCRAEHSEPADTDQYLAAVGEMIEALLPTGDADLRRLTVDPSIWTHDHGDSESTVRGSVQAALTSLILEHLDALGGGDARQRGPQPPL